MCDEEYNEAVPQFFALTPTLIQYCCDWLSAQSRSEPRRRSAAGKWKEGPMEANCEPPRPVDQRTCEDRSDRPRDRPEGWRESSASGKNIKNGPQG